MTDKLTDHQIETLAEHWPWEFDEIAVALRLAEAEGWPLDDTVRALDVIAENFADSDPEDVMRQAIAYKRRQQQALKRLGPS